MKYLVILLFVFCCNNASAQTPDTTPAFRVKVSGNGEQPILFIPGFASSGAVWNATRAMFANKYKTYTFTMAGFAGVPPQHNPTFWEWIDAFGSYMKKHQIQNAIIVGHSIGGLMAMAIAAHYPKRVSKVVVVDALPFLAGLKRPGFKAQKTRIVPL